MLIGGRDARPAAPRGSPADTAAQRHRGAFIRGFSLTRKEPAVGGGGAPLPSSPCRSSPLPLRLYCVDDGEGGSFGVWKNEGLAAAIRVGDLVRPDDSDLGFQPSVALLAGRLGCAGGLGVGRGQGGVGRVQDQASECGLVFGNEGRVSLRLRCRLPGFKSCSQEALGGLCGSG